MLDTPFGKFYGPNITPHPESGLGKWSEVDFRRAMRLGERPDGADIAAGGQEEVERAIGFGVAKRRRRDRPKRAERRGDLASARGRLDVEQVGLVVLLTRCGPVVERGARAGGMRGSRILFIGKSAQPSALTAALPRNACMESALERPWWRACARSTGSAASAGSSKRAAAWIDGRPSRSTS